MASVPTIGAEMKSAVRRATEKALSKGKGKGTGLIESQICFFHNPARGKECRILSCVRIHLDTRFQEQADRYNVAIRSYMGNPLNWEGSRQALMEEGLGRSRRSPSPRRRAEGGSRSSSRGAVAPRAGRSGGERGRSRTPAPPRAAPRPRDEAATEGIAHKKPSPNAFLEFMRTQPQDVPPKAALEAYTAHTESQKHHRVVEFFDAHKTDGILADSHRGTHLLRGFDWQIIRTHLAAASFLTDLKSGTFAGLSLAMACQEAEWIVASSGLGSAVLPGPANAAPHLLADLSSCCMAFDSIGASFSAWDFHEALQHMPGFIDVWLGKPAPQSLLREGRARFDSDAHLEAAMQQFNGAAVKDYIMRPTKAPSEEKHRVLLAPPAASAPVQLAATARLAAVLAIALDGAAGLPGTPAREVLEAHENNPEARLDLLALYLRRVHCFCLYSLAWCKDERDLISRCGAACLRMQGKGWNGEKAWAQEHLQALRRFITELDPKPRPEAVPASVAEEPLNERWEAVRKDSGKMEAEGRHRCLQCSKLFKGEEFLEKHLLKSHHEGFSKLVKDLRDEQMRESYLKDSHHPELDGPVLDR